MEPSKTSQTRWERHHNTFTPSLHLVPFCQQINNALHVFVSCVHSRIVEGSWEGIAGCVVHVAVHGECVCCWWVQCSCSRRDDLGWLLFMVTKYPLYSNRMLYFRTKLTFRLLFCSLHQRIHSMHKTLLCILCMLCIL